MDYVLLVTYEFKSHPKIKYFLWLFLFQYRTLCEQSQVLALGSSQYINNCNIFYNLNFQATKKEKKMPFPKNKTKLVCTIGPASEAPEIILQLIHAGMNVARLNYSHGDFSWHRTITKKLNEAARQAGRRLAIMADLPGPKMRIGMLDEEPIELGRHDEIILTTDDIIGNRHRVSVSFSRLPKVVKIDDTMYLNDGIIRLQVLSVDGNDVRCLVRSGGELRSHKGLNLPGINLGMSAFTEHDYDCLKNALESGVDAVSQSFVETAEDIETLRRAASDLGYKPFIIAKIERAGALENYQSILQAADGIMVARGDLGVEIQIERIAIVQKDLMRAANRMGKPVITATQMLESMVEHSRPTRAESTDVSNAILDGTDCLMLSEESAMGRYPVEAAEMLARIAIATEPHRATAGSNAAIDTVEENPDRADVISCNVQHTVQHLTPLAVIAHTTTGYTARMISRFKLPLWIAAVSHRESTCQGLQFSYGVFPVHEPQFPDDWEEYARSWAKGKGLKEGLLVLTEGPSPDNPDANHRLEIIDLGHVKAVK